jgi:hypothetical protein
MGSLTGTHALSIAVVGPPIPISGSVSFRLSGSTNTLDVVDGELSGQFSAASFAYGTFSAGLAGTYDCTSRHLNASLVGGQIDAPPVLLPIEGTVEGDFSGTSFSGQWDENETGQTSAKGSGTWSATWRGP